MDYIPTAINRVLKGVDSDGLPRWRDLSAHDVKVLLDPEVADEIVEGYFPGCGFYGPLIGKADPDDMKGALEVLRAILELHAMLEGCDSLIELDPENWHLPTLHRVNEVERIATRHLEVIGAALTEQKRFNISIGTGYDEAFNNEDSIPQCHILRMEMPLPPMYGRWLSQRVAIYNAVACAMRSSQTFYLHMHNQVQLLVEDGVQRLRIDVYGTQTLDEGWDDWLEKYESSIEGEVEVSALEKVAGLRHLADVMATMHLSSAIPIVDQGAFGRFGAEDSLTDLWLRLYDPASDSDYSIGSCEVCGRLFIGSHKGKRGHDACMNRQRVVRSRTRKFAKLIESGMSQQEASRIAGIAAAKALEEMTREGFLAEFDSLQ